MKERNLPVDENEDNTPASQAADERDNPQVSSDQSSSDETESASEEPEEHRILFLKAAQGYGMILGFGGGYILSGILSELGLQAGKFECVIVGMIAGMAIGYLISNKKK